MNRELKEVNFPNKYVKKREFLYTKRKTRKRKANFFTRKAKKESCIPAELFTQNLVHNIRQDNLIVANLLHYDNIRKISPLIIYPRHE